MIILLVAITETWSLDTTFPATSPLALDMRRVLLCLIVTTKLEGMLAVPPAVCGFLGSGSRHDPRSQR